MKKIIITLFVLFSSISLVFAETNINFSSNKKVYNIEENIIFNIDLTSDYNWKFELAIENLDDLQIVWKREYQNTRIINWNKEQSFSIKLSLLAKKSWKYTIWPVTTKEWDIEIKSKILNIEVTWERIMINNNIKNDDEDNEIDEEEININNIDLNNSWLKEDIKIIPKKIIWIDWKEMLDIYPQKDFLLWALFSKTSIIFSIIIIVFIIIIIYFNNIYNKFIWYILNKLENNKRKEKKIIPQKLKIKKEINYNDLINILEKDYLTEKKDIFYWKTSELFRIFLDDKVRQWLSTKSFKEIWNYLNNDLKEIYKKIYFPEYSKYVDSIEIRKEILDELKIIITN